MSDSDRQLELRVVVRPRWAFRLPRQLGRDGLTRRRSGVLHRLLHFGEQRVFVRVAQSAPDRVVFAAQAGEAAAAEWGIERMRFALGVDQHLQPFHERFRSDPLIGAAVRADPRLRIAGRPDPFEALLLTICEQLIEYDRAAAIQRRLIARLGRRCPVTGLSDAPTAATIASVSPALLASLGLSDGRALALWRAGREISRGRIDLSGPDHERGWRRLRAIPGVGSWTVQTLAMSGQGRLDQLPAGDLAYLKLVGALVIGERSARASEDEVSAFFEPYAPWAGLAGAYALRAGASRAAIRIAA